MVDTFNRWFGTPTGQEALSVGMLAVLIITCLAAVLGHGTLEKGIRGINVVSIVVLVIAVRRVRVQVPRDPGLASTCSGSFWPTWFIATTTTASLPISWGPFVGDYGRYIPASTPSWKVSAYAVTGIFLGLLARDDGGRVRGHLLPSAGRQLRHRHHRRLAGLAPVPAAAGARPGVEHRQRGHVAV